MRDWNGVSFLPLAQQLPVVEMASDASGSWGCGAWHGTHWFQVQWDDRSVEAPIMVKELIPVVLAVDLWGTRWSNCLVRCFCDNQAVEIFTPFPVYEQLLCSFVAYLADEGLSPQTAKSYLAAVRNAQLSLGLPDPRETSSLPILKRVQAGIARVILQRGRSTRIRLPISAELLDRIRVTLLKSSDPERALFWAICCSAFFGFFRLGELLLASSSNFDDRLHLAWGDVAFDHQTHPSMARVLLKRSKTDQVGKGCHVMVGRTGRELCPIAALLGYIAIRGDRMGPFFIDSAAVPMTKGRFISRLRAVLTEIGVPQDQYAGHRFRIGAATSAALAGVEDSMIQTLGRWKSAAFFRYVRTPPEELAAISVTLASENHHLAARQTDATRSRRTNYPAQPTQISTYKKKAWGRAGYSYSFAPSLGRM